MVNMLVYVMLQVFDRVDSVDKIREVRKGCLMDEWLLCDYDIAQSCGLLAGGCWGCTLAEIYSFEKRPISFPTACQLPVPGVGKR